MMILADIASLLATWDNSTYTLFAGVFVGMSTLLFMVMVIERQRLL